MIGLEELHELRRQSILFLSFSYNDSNLPCVSMNTDGAEPAFRIWGADDFIHGPLDLPSLIQWVRAKKVKPSTWIFVEPAESWVRRPTCLN